MYWFACKGILPLRNGFYTPALNASSLAGQDEVLVLDTDAIFRKESFARHGLASCYFGVMEDAQASVAAGAEHYQVFVNAAVLLVRETPWTRALLRLLLRDRCGE